MAMLSKKSKMKEITDYSFNDRMNVTVSRKNTTKHNMANGQPDPSQVAKWLTAFKVKETSQPY